MKGSREKAGGKGSDSGRRLRMSKPRENQARASRESRTNNHQCQPIKRRHRANQKAGKDKIIRGIKEETQSEN